MLCVVIKGPTYEDARRQIQEALCFGIVELRLDLYTGVTLEQIQKIRTDFLVPIVLTLRSQVQGGDSSLSGNERLLRLRQLAELHPDYLDVEYPDDVAIVPELKGVPLILSHHNVDRTPIDLHGLYAHMQNFPASIYKIAVKATSTLDVMRLICWAKDKKCVAISMGSAGQISRILSPVLNNPITYACLDEEPTSPLAQLSVSTLIRQYGIRSLTPQTALYGLIGDPVTRSISDVTHNHYFQAHNLNAIYVKIQVPPSELEAFLQLAKQLPFQGLSVTMPLKEIILPYLDQIDREAHIIGAVNTLVLQEGKWMGYNTDGIGALNAIEKHLPIRGKRCVILGAGGAAKAIVHEAYKRGALLTILNRHIEKAEELAKSYHAEAKSLDQIKEIEYDILINCTPTDLPIDPQYLLPHALIMDIRTKPKETPLLKQALDKGCSIVYGYEMFIEQALLQFALWGVLRAPRESRTPLEKTALQAL